MPYETSPTSTSGNASGKPQDLRVAKGTAYVSFAFDIGQSIDLEQAERHIAAATHRELIRHKRPAPPYFQFDQPPLRYCAAADPIRIADFATDASVDFVLYDFGAVSVTHRIPLGGNLTDLLPLGDALYDNAALLAASRAGVTRLLDAIRPAVVKPFVYDLVEDYVVYQLEELTGHELTSPTAHVDPLRAHATTIAQLLRAECGPFSAQEIAEALACQVSYGADDVTIIDWNAALVRDTDAAAVLAVLEYANVELLEMRFLDGQLDTALEEAYDMFNRRRWPGGGRLRPHATDLRHVARLQLDAALLFEGVNNALKLLGDQYLARVYRLASQRLHLDAWDTNILRKLQTLDSTYQKLSNEQSARRMEILEWIIIILIAISIVLPFIP